MILNTLSVDPDRGLVLLTGEVSLAAQVERRLRFMRGEYWLNQLAGIPWPLLLGHGISPELLSSEIAAEVKLKPGVIRATVLRVTLPEVFRDGIEVELEVEYDDGVVRLSATIGG